MKRTLIFLFSFFLIFVMLVSVVFADEEDDFLNALRQKREKDWELRKKLQKIDAERRDPRLARIYLFKDVIKANEELKNKAVQGCLSHDDDKLMQQVKYGRYISAFEMCKQQKVGVQECIQKVKEIKEKWREACKDADASLKLMYYTLRLRAEEINAQLENIKNQNAACAQADASSGLAALAFREACAFQNQLIGRWFPGSEFNLLTGTGKIVASDAVFNYQGWSFVRGDFPMEGGILMQIFEGRMNFIAGSYSIAVNFKTQGGWEIVEFNLPFDSQTEQILNTLSGRGVRLTNKEIIDLVNRYLHDTLWEVDLPFTFKKLLLDADERRFLMESLIEYYAYANYLKKVVADEARLKQQTQREQEREQKTEKTTGKKGRGTKK
jgi:hypothetical protein